MSMRGHYGGEVGIYGCRDRCAHPGEEAGSAGGCTITERCCAGAGLEWYGVQPCRSATSFAPGYTGKTPDRVMCVRRNDQCEARKKRWAAFCRIFVCSLIFCTLLSAIPAGVAAANGAVSFPDTNLEGAVRDALDKPEGDITTDDMAALGVLDADDEDIGDLTGLEHAVNLRDLDLDSNKISDLGPLANLTGLRSLDLESNEISDISPLAGLTDLRSLDLDGNQVSDLGPLANLTNLRDLDLDSNQVSDISPLANLTNLRDLDLDSNQVSDISPLANLTNLRDLDLDSNQVSNISPLANLTNLRDLDLDSNQVSDISPLAGLTNLRDIDLEHNEISDLGPLADSSEFGSGGSLEVEYNNLDLTPGSAAMKDIGTLESRGMYVSYIPQRR